MIFDHDVDLSADYEHRTPEITGLPWGVLVSQTGLEAVVLVHELPGLTPAVASLGDALRDAGFKVYMPSLFGKPGANPGPFAAGVDSVLACVRTDIAAFARGDSTREIVVHLRALANQASAETGGRRVGIIGLCLSGGFAIASATEAVVAAAVASEPSLPLFDDRHIDVSADDQNLLATRVNAGGLRAMLLRFQGDKLSPCARVGRFGQVLGAALLTRCVPDAAADPNWRGAVHHHCVLTNELVDAPGSLTKAARDEVIAFFAWRLRGGPEPVRNPKLSDCLRRGCARAQLAGPPAPAAALPS